MRIGKRAQYALLLSFYLARSGRANVRTAAENLNVSQAFLEQIARKLRMNKVISVKRGPGGGASLNPDVTVLDVLSAVDSDSLLSEQETKTLLRGGIEHRAAAGVIGNLGVELNVAMGAKIQDVLSSTDVASES